MIFFDCIMMCVGTEEPTTYSTSNPTSTTLAPTSKPTSNPTSATSSEPTPKIISEFLIF